MGFPGKAGVVKESVYFNGYKYNRYPEAKKLAHRRYFTRAGGGLLHRHVWEFHNGPIPAGHHIHHKDGNWSNNDISNLECLSACAHGDEHSEQRSANAKRPEQLAHLASINHMAKAWHSSPEGLAWHKENGHATWANRKPVEHTCKECGVVFQSLKTTRVYFCGSKCSAANWRKEHPDYYTPEAKAKRLQSKR